MARRIKPAGQTQAERDLIALGRIESYMDSVVTSQQVCPTCNTTFPFREITPGAAQLLRARYDKLRPSLSSIEQTNLNPEDKATESDILAKLSALVAEHPDLIRSLLDKASAPAATPLPGEVGDATAHNMHYVKH
jgi:hypothetical protein